MIYLFKENEKSGSFAYWHYKWINLKLLNNAMKLYIYIVRIFSLVHVRLYVCLSDYYSLIDTHVPVYRIPEHWQILILADQQTTVGRETLSMIGPRLLIYR